MTTTAQRGFVTTLMPTLIAYFDLTMVCVFASGVLHQRAGVLFGEARHLDANTNECVLSVRRLTP
jgi:hypothetical protein